MSVGLDADPLARFLGLAASRDLLACLVGVTYSTSLSAPLP